MGSAMADSNAVHQHQQPRPKCSVHRWQAGSTPSKQQRNTRTPAAAYTVLANSDQHLQQIEKLEKQLFAKSDGWRGDVFMQEVSKRNTFLLYALAAASSCNEGDDNTATESVSPARTQQPLRHHQPAEKQDTMTQQQQQQQAVLGYIIVQVNSVTAHINKLAVVPHARRRGLGAALLRAALHVAIHERRALCSTLHVDAINTPAIALYSNAGFKRNGIIADYYGPGKPALKLLADLRECADVAAFVGATNAAFESA